MPRRIDVTGQKFNHLTALKCVGNNERHELLWECRCDCGEIKIVLSSNLRLGNTISCGCIRRPGTRTHGEAGRGDKRSPEYQVWHDMRFRCTNPNYKQWKDYGGRGIRVCDRWKDFETFLADILASIGRRPSPKHSLDRYPDNDGNYEPGNVRWATRKQQRANQRH